MRRFFSSSLRPFFTSDHEALRSVTAAFVKAELKPFVNQWDEQGSFPRELYKKAGDVGLLQVGFPDSVGGTHEDIFSKITLGEEMCESGCGGVNASLMSHAIAMPPIVALGSTELKKRVVEPVLQGLKISALAITEPSGGSDVANLKTKAVRDGDHYIINGEKCFITSGVRADHLTVAVRTGKDGPGGISLIVVDGDAEGLERTPMKKMGWWASDTAFIRFSDCRVPASNLVGKENDGFKGIMINFNSERLLLAAQALGFSKVCFREATEWAQQRKTFGKPLIERQVIRHMLVDMAMNINAVAATLDVVANCVHNGGSPVAEICLLKNQATECLEKVANDAVQIMGGAGYIRESCVERIYRETKVLSIGGGSTQIMKDLSARQMGW